MKRVICLILAVVLLASLLLAIVPAVSAAGFGKHHQAKTKPVCTYVDADQDGVCDNRRENCGQRFVDENDDGICDNRTEKGCGNPQRPASCPRQMMGRGMGRGCGRR